MVGFAVPSGLPSIGDPGTQISDGAHGRNSLPGSSRNGYKGALRVTVGERQVRTEDRMRQRPRLLTGVVIALSALVLPVPALARAPSEAAQVQTQLAGVRLPFIANQGQVDARVAYTTPRPSPARFFVTQRGSPSTPSAGRRPMRRAIGADPPSSPGWSLTETLRGGRARPVAQDRSTTGVSTFLGNDPARWRAALPTWEQVSLGEAVARRHRGAAGAGAEHGEGVHGAPRRRGGAHPGARGGAHALSVDDGEGRWWRARDSGPSRSPRRSPIKSATACAGRSPSRIAFTEFEYGFSVGAYDPRLCRW